MKSFRLVKYLLVIALLFISFQIQAIPLYYWVLRISASLNTQALALARIASSADAADRSASMQLFRIAPGGVRGRPSTRDWNIKRLMRINWPIQPQLSLQSNFIHLQSDNAIGSFQSRGLGVIASSGSSRIPGVISHLNTQWQLSPSLPLHWLFGESMAHTLFQSYIHGKLSASLGSWLNQEGINLGIPENPAQTGAIQSILQSLHPVHAVTHESNAPLVQEIPGIFSSEEASNANNIPNPDILNLLGCILADGATPPATTTLYSSVYDVYLGLTGSGDNVQAHALVPHHVMVQSGLILGAREENPIHMDPEQWQETDEN